MWRDFRKNGSKGSPPPVWGTPSATSAMTLMTGITPTCVGNTDGKWPNKCSPSGSPPPVWGTPRNCVESLKELGITPTCVGNTLRPTMRTLLPWDHPHLCGEHRKTRLSSAADLGSPPPVWGTLPATSSSSSIFRITPTCVGNTNE